MWVTQWQRWIVLVALGGLIVSSRVLFALQGTQLRGVVVDASGGERLGRVRIRVDDAHR
jgi:hypothetical protein